MPSILSTIDHCRLLACKGYAVDEIQALCDVHYHTARDAKQWADRMGKWGRYAYSKEHSALRGAEPAEAIVDGISTPSAVASAIRMGEL